ncbi:hypothetical protein D3C73_1058180 [compost metagenome]
MQHYRFAGGGQHPSADGEYPAKLTDRRDEIPGDIRERRQNQIAETMSGQSFPGAEAIPHNLRHQRLDIGHGRQHVADIAGRRHLQLAPQNTGAASVICHSHYRCDIERLFLQPAKHDRESRTSAHNDDTRTFVLFFSHN